MYVVKDEKKLRDFSSLFKQMFPNIEFIIMPAWDCMPYDNISPNSSIIGERIKNFLRLIENGVKQKLIIITINAIFKRIFL